MITSPKYDVPWDLISESFTGNLTAEEELQLQQWLSVDPGNREKYNQLRDLWGKGMEDYSLYKMANEKEAWKALHRMLGKVKPKHIETKVIDGQFTPTQKLSRGLIAIAAVFIVLFGIGLWMILTNDNPVVYETANVQRKITLDDGSTITLQPVTKIEVSHNYNKTNRTIVMVSGEAYFDVAHQAAKPFIVELGKAQIKDIGTSFTIQKGEKEIDIAVTSGKVIFVKLATKETRELNAGTSITFDVQKESFREVQLINSSSKVYEQMLNFDNTLLTDVVAAIQIVYGKKIILNDTNIANKRITAQLGGMPCNLAIEVICKSLGLEYSVNDSIYIIKEREKEQP